MSSNLVFFSQNCALARALLVAVSSRSDLEWLADRGQQSPEPHPSLSLALQELK